MSNRLQALLREIRTLEKDVQDELHRVQEKVTFTIKEGRVSFPKDIIKFHRSLRKNIIRYLYESNFLFILSAPVIYSLVVPAVILDAFCRFYQMVCFPIYRIPKVERGDYIRMDRHKLAYLNGIEKVNCEYCAYFNGILAFAREIASRTEQYWCPIRHALAVKGSHARYLQFIEYGEAKSYRAQLNRLRLELQNEKKLSL